MRAQLKRLLIAGYCQHLIPGWIVTSAFWTFRLRHL